MGQNRNLGYWLQSGKQQNSGPPKDTSKKSCWPRQKVSSPIGQLGLPIAPDLYLIPLGQVGLPLIGEHHHPRLLDLCCVRVSAHMHTHMLACMHACVRACRVQQWAAAVTTGRWPYCADGHIALVAILRRWPYCTGGHIAHVAILHRWPYCTGGHIAQVAMLQQWAAALTTGLGTL